MTKTTIGFMPRPVAAAPVLPAIEPDVLATPLATGLIGQFDKYAAPMLPGSHEERAPTLELQLKQVRGGVVVKHIPAKAVEVIDALDKALTPLVTALDTQSRQKALAEAYPVLIGGRSELSALSTFTAKLLASEADWYVATPTFPDLPQQAANSVRSASVATDQFCALVSVLGEQGSLTQEEWIRILQSAAGLRGDLLRHKGDLGSVRTKIGTPTLFDQNFSGVLAGVEKLAAPPVASTPAASGGGGRT